MSASKPLKPYYFTLAAGVRQEIKVAGNFIGVYTAASTVQIQADDNKPLPLNQGDRQTFEQPYQSLALESAANQVVLIIAGFGELKSDLSGVSVAATATIVSPSLIIAPAHVVVPDTTTTLLLPAYAGSQQRIEIYSPITNVTELFLGPATLAAGHGMALAPGAGLELDLIGALYGYHAAGVNQTYYIGVVQRP